MNTYDQIRDALVNKHALEVEHSEKGSQGIRVICPLILGVSKTNERVLCFQVTGYLKGLQKQGSRTDARFLFAKVDDLKILSKLSGWYCPRHFDYNYWADSGMFKEIHIAMTELDELKKELANDARSLILLTCSRSDGYGDLLQRDELESYRSKRKRD